MHGRSYQDAGCDNYPPESQGVFRVIAVLSRPVQHNWVTISFASTLYLCPILDLLLAEIPAQCHLEIRLGLQEALVNAAKHGNQLDSSKTIVVRFSVVQNQFWWVITDQGAGFNPPSRCNMLKALDQETLEDSDFPEEGNECGRGLYILHQVFDWVEWNRQGTELTLCKEINT